MATTETRHHLTDVIQGVLIDTNIKSDTTQVGPEWQFTHQSSAPPSAASTSHPASAAFLIVML
jgi:hypothetical protein